MTGPVSVAIAAVVAIAVFGYLLYSLLRPERF
jgi:K+-transporting ATPase KdpF subunit